MTSDATKEEKATTEEDEKQITTHCLVPESMAQKLRLLSALTRIQQSVYLRDGVRDGLKKYGARRGTALPRATKLTERMVSLTPRIPKAELDGLKELSERTRVRQSEWLRLFLQDVLSENSAKLQAEVEAEAQQYRPIAVGDRP